MTTHGIGHKIIQGLLPLTGILFVFLHTAGGQEEAPPPSSPKAVAVDQDDATGKIPLRILYVGLPDTPRRKEFVDFLGRHFTQVEFADYYAFKEDSARDCDVVILDKDGLEWKSLAIKVSDSYSRATVSIGVPGAFWCDRLNLKTGYM